MINYEDDIDIHDDILDDFDDIDIIDDIGIDADISEGKLKNSYARVKRYKRTKNAKYENAVKMVKDIGKVETDDHINAIVSGNFIAGDFIEAFLFENNLIAKEIIIATLSMSRENVDSLKNVQDFRLSGRMGIIISDYFFSHERRSGIEDICNNLGGELFTLAVAGIHTKLTLIKTECGMSIVIGGSANLRSSMNIEQITIDNNADIYDFHREWMAGILNKYQADHKMLRRNELWQQVARDVEQ